MAMRNFKYRRRIKMCILNYKEYRREYSIFSGIEYDETALDAAVYPEWVQSFVNAPQEPHGDSSLCSVCSDLQQTIDPHDLCGSFSFHFNPPQDPYDDPQPLCIEPLDAVSPRNPDGVLQAQPEPFSLHQRSREGETHESLPRRQRSEPLQRSLSVSPGHNAASSQPARYHNMSCSISCFPKPKILHCTEEACKGVFFKDERTLRRHLYTKHSGAFYVCRCGYSNGRIDTYRNHISKDKCSSEQPYTCKCGYATYDLTEQQSHLDSHPKGKPGRPTKENTGQ
ncbi:uncharacterized protein FPRO_03642 [Fusarium proliferatum ET1]|uniref:C2H2-type domain-containing protein n=1 Tax=Fusarium proliferatum (strain ET1) TaxID=1227346 RepID=A0A1L7V5I1_FUSPR|nr:uncharacterized protein FPRO_03642 [Fusarium proliferatum ET1]CZR36098.1 uncharacterized protein FPRO_03642 [Fusarium proliferatum ET1]